METRYRPVTAEIVAELAGIVGERHVLCGEPERMWAYAHDEVAGDEYAHVPEVVVKPDGAAEIGAIMRLANRERLPVTPRGAGSGLSGGAVPVRGGIVLSLERMNRILEIDREQPDGHVVEPGVVTNEINKAVTGARAVLRRLSDEPGDVLHRRQRGRERRRRQGGQVRRHRPLRARPARSSCPPARSSSSAASGSRTSPATTCIHLLVGSEGTLGIFTRITLRLLPLPTARGRACWCLFADVRSRRSPPCPRS